MAAAVRRPATLALAGCVMMAAAPAAGQTVDTLALERHARFLADDLLEGRGPASRGEQLAALYLTTRIAAWGLLPLPGQSSYRLPVPLTAVHVDEMARVRIVGSEERAMRPPAFYHPGGSRSAFRDFAGDLLFAGPTPGALDALARHEDLASTVVVLTPPWSALDEVNAELVRRGAAGALALIPDGAVYERLRIVRGPIRYFLPDGVEDPVNQSTLPSLVAGPAMIDALDLEADVTAGQPLQRARSLDRRMEVHLPHRTEEHTGYNVAGYVPGADPVLRDEWVILVAHYDHVGFGEAEGGDSIWNGFVDNAAGSAMLLEIARAIADDPPARSTAFVWVTAEEQGLLGANWFVHSAVMPVERIRAVLNLDGGAPPAPPIEWGLVGAGASPIGVTARRVIERHDWLVQDVAIGPQSDHWPFHLAGAPVVMLFPGSGLEGLAAEAVAGLRERWLRPHTPHDEWHPDFPLAGLGRYATLALEIVRTLGGQERQVGRSYSPTPARAPRVETAAGLSLEVLVDRAALGGPEVEIGEITFPPGTGAGGRAHSHGRVEILFILSGRLDHIVNDTAHVLTPGMIGIVRAGDRVVHRVVGDAPVRALVVWAPGGELEGILPYFREPAATERRER